MPVDRVRLLRDTVKSLEAQKNFPYSQERRGEWEIALSEAEKMLEIEKQERRK